MGEEFGDVLKYYRSSTQNNVVLAALVVQVLDILRVEL